MKTFNNDFYDSRKSYSYKTRFSCLQFSNKKISVEQNEKKNFKAKLKAEIIIVKLGNDHCDDFCFLMELRRRPNLDQVSGDLGNEGLKGGGGWG